MRGRGREGWREEVKEREEEGERVGGRERETGRGGEGRERVGGREGRGVGEEGKGWRVWWRARPRNKGMYMYMYISLCL